MDMLGMDDGMVALAWLGTVLSAAFASCTADRWKQGFE